MKSEDRLIYESKPMAEIIIVLLLFSFGVFSICCWLGYLGEASRGDGYAALIFGVFFILAAAAVSLMVGARSLVIDHHAKTITYRVKKTGRSEQVTIRRFSDVEVVQYFVRVGDFNRAVVRVTLRMKDKSGIHLPKVSVPETKSIAREIAATVGTKMQDVTNGSGVAESPF